MSFFKAKYLSLSSIVIPTSTIKWLDYTRNFNHCSCLKFKHQVPIEKDENINVDSNIIKLGFNDPTLSKILQQVKSKKMRKKSNLTFFEGKRLLKEALDAGVIPLMVFFSRKVDIEEIKFPENTKLFKMPYNEIKLWSNLTTAPGILAVCRQPNIVKLEKPDIPVTIICDNIREPGNLGALIRNAAGAGVKNVILSKGCVDAWEPKVIRGSAGTHFRFPVHNDVDWPSMKNYLDDNTLVLVATNNHILETKTTECVIPYCSLDYHNYSNIALIIGGETEGVSEDAIKFVQFYNHRVVTIPLSNNVESLNSVSALSIILFEIKRQMVYKKCEKY